MNELEDTLLAGVVLFERYKIIRPLGIGGTSIVYLAQNNKIGSLVAIKAIKKTEDEIDLLAEKNILIELRHPSIPIIMDIEEDEDRIYLIEEYVEGKVLEKYKNKLTEQEIIDIMLQLCDVLNYLHTFQERPIIYRDLKPSNVIRMQNGHIKLIDFGIAKKYSHETTRDTTQFGTRGYAAPEQFGFSKADVRTDIFALGVSMYYLLTGKNLSTPPYRLQPLRDENPYISSGLEQIIMKCMETVQAKRYQNIATLRQDVNALGNRKNDNNDYDVFLEKSRNVITVTGINRSLGTTHVAIMLAHYFKEQGQKVALIEWQAHHDFIKICNMYKTIKEEKFYFVFNAIHFYSYQNNLSYDKSMVANYDVIIVDGGQYDDLEQKGSYQKSHQVLMLCGGKDWEIDSFEEYYFGSPNKSYYYMFNFMDDTSFRVVKESMANFKCHQVPYNPNPYLITETTQKILDDIFGVVATKALGIKRSKLDDVKDHIRSKIQVFKNTKRKEQSHSGDGRG
ncbi:serine/threonine-protein kinase [Petrocella sp. FN5]|uniref:serine/threonine-protein kinase n=1 Tax=Petrocella sp. FN5 TaxID=3032002 RepID=UPI0023DA2C38|nr:serine/threonine-protein kinase [Petrocella sp. FN5]MDF1616892.1 serine/threonine-protein kinase [Petrocella sp. FN5]